MSDTNLTFVTVKWGVKYDADYVNILFDMVRRNLPPGCAFSFVCFTDDSSGILPGIEIRPLQRGLSGWWNKLYLFKPGVLPEDARIVFLDLDTAITGDLSGIVAYRGDFGILRDFYRPDGLNSGLMLWPGGFGASIWDSYEEAGYPDISGGDQAWIERCKPKADILQDLFPGAVLSFKENARFTLPAGAKIVCFHGDPKPPQIKNGWVEHVWKIGGAVPTASATIAPPAEEEPIENVRQALALPFPWLDTLMPTNSDRHVCIVGGGMSAERYVAELKDRQRQGQTIWALNGAFQWLAQRGIEPAAHVMSGARATYAGHVPEQTRAMLFYASQCHPAVFEKAAQLPDRVIVWHSLIDGIHNLLGQRNAVLIGNSGTTGIKAINVAKTLGFGNIHLYGFDSSFPAKRPQNDAANDADRAIQVDFDGHSFESSPRLAQQVNDYRTLKQVLSQKGVYLSVYGDGLLPSVARKLAQMNSF